MAGRKTSHAMASTQRANLKSSGIKAQKDLERMSPDMNWGLGMAKVTNIDYEEFTVGLRTLTGASQMYERVPVPISFPGAGKRHFFGAMPQNGDVCVVGWAPQESSEKGGGTKTPIVLAWIAPGTAFARDWVTSSDFDPDEYDLASPRDQGIGAGSYANVRLKMRHMQPGNILASSAQGSDLVLDEGVLLTNRRGNEIRLRDQDQALILRSLQQFHAMAGARIYAGMVQRDATFLPKTMISDGTVWDDPNQSLDGVPFNITDNEPDLSAPKGFLSPSAMLARSRTSTGTSRSTIGMPVNLDPYVFLTRGGFINDSGFAVDGMSDPSGYYGGKPIYRVASSGKSNAVNVSDQPTFTEYRLEINHTSTGRLPVTEQTDMFDADRLPTSNPNADPVVPPSNVPFLEWVMGSVVGNDPFTQEGRKKYGMPLVARIFEGDVSVPRLDAADIGTASGTPIGDHLATLFRMVPPVDNTESSGTFWGVNKSGQFRASIGGNPKDNSAEVALSGNLKLGMGGGLRIISDGHVEWVTRNKSSLNLAATEGAVRIYGGGPTKSNAAVGERNTGTDGGEGDIPAVDIEAKTNVRIKAEKLVAIKAGLTTVNATVVNLTAHEELTLDGVKRTSTSTENYSLSVSGKAQESFGGPKYGLPTNMPLHERTYAPLSTGVCEKVLYVLGDREETFNVGNHKTTILIGDMTYETNLGTWSARAVQSKMEMGSTGIAGTAQAGTISLKAAAGTATLSGLAGVTIVADGGTATVRGSAGVYLGAPVAGPDIGPVLCAGTLEPLTGLPFATWGLGAKNVIVGA
jgi:hypothetical protein